MEIEKFEIDDLALLKPNVFEDSRGYFLESYNESKLSHALGYNVNFVQDNESKSTFGILRGIHFQKPPFAQAKLVRVVEGEVLDVAIDLRKNSKTFGSYKSFILSGENKQQLFVPRGFGHAFLVKSETAIFSYKVDNYYAPQSDSGIIWNDDTLNIDWGLMSSDIKLSHKDQNLKSFNEYLLNPDF